MTSPAQTQPSDPSLFQEAEPEFQIAALRAQRNEAHDEAGQWRSIALRERQVTQMLAQRCAELEGLLEAKDGDKQPPRKAPTKRATPRR